jgi:hypothetical protein
MRRSPVRVRITRPRRGEIDGVNLSHLETGIVYNLPTTLAAYLLLTQSAEAAKDGEPDRPETMVFRGLPPPADVAADAGLDEEFIETLERVCHTNVIVSSDERLCIPLDFDDEAPEVLLQTPPPTKEDSERRAEKPKTPSRPCRL